MRPVLVLVVLLSFVSAAWAGPATPTFTATVGKAHITIPLPPDVQLVPAQSGPSTYFMTISESGKPKLRVQIILLATSKDVPKSDLQIRQGMTGMVHGSKLGIPDSQIKIQKMTDLNPSFVLAHGFYTVKAQEGRSLVMSPNILISKKQDVVIPFTVTGLVLVPNPPAAEIDKAQRYVRGLVALLVRNARISY